MFKKYETTTQSIEWKGRKLFRVKAVKSFADVKVGDLGGYIENEINLSQDGTAWVSDDAKVFNNAEIYGNSWIYGKAEIHDNAKVYDTSEVFGNICVCGKSRICGDTVIYDNALVGKQND